MSRRFPLRPALPGAGGNWRQTITMPPPGAPGVGGGTPALFVAGAMLDFRTEFTLYLLAIHNCPEDAEVEWRELSETNGYMLGEGEVRTGHAILVADAGHDTVISLTVNGEPAGQFNAASPGTYPEWDQFDHG